MTFLNLGVMLAILGLGMVASMVYYGSRGKKKMGEGFARLAEAIGGTSVQQSRMHYPRLTGTVGGREVTIQVHLSAAQRRASDIVYLVLSTPVALPAATLVVREGYFAAAPGQGAFNDVAGDYLEGLLPGRYVYAEDEPVTRALLAADGVAEAIEALSAYPSLVLGPVVGAYLRTRGWLFILLVSAVALLVLLALSNWDPSMLYIVRWWTAPGTIASLQ